VLLPFADEQGLAVCRDCFSVRRRQRIHAWRAQHTCAPGIRRRDLGANPGTKMIGRQPNLVKLPLASSSGRNDEGTGWHCFPPVRRSCSADGVHRGIVSVSTTTTSGQSVRHKEPWWSGQPGTISKELKARLARRRIMPLVPYNVDDCIAPPLTVVPHVGQLAVDPQPPEQHEQHGEEKREQSSECIELILLAIFISMPRCLIAAFYKRHTTYSKHHRSRTGTEPLQNHKVIRGKRQC